MALTPLAEVMVNLWARPLFAMSSKVPGMIITIAVAAMLCDSSWYWTVAESAVD